MTTYLIIDTQNLFLRVRFGIKAPDIESQIGMALHITMQSIKKCWKDFDAAHTVFALEGRSWRKNIYSPYKANRKAASMARTPREIEDDKTFFEVMDHFIQFLKNKTNCSVLQHQEAEADDLIARWVQLHPTDQHVIISTDRDFQQLIAPNVKLYNGINGILYGSDVIIDKDGKEALDKNGKILTPPDPDWVLFEKCIRGDDGDNVMSAYPGVRTKRLQEAFNDRINKGYAWNNLMLSKWTDHNGIDHRVKDDYERNKLLIDLTMQPRDLIEKFDRSIIDSVNKPLKNQIGISLMRFCNLHGLVRIENQTAEFSPCFSSNYKGDLLIHNEEVTQL